MPNTIDWTRTACVRGARYWYAEFTLDGEWMSRIIHGSRHRLIVAGLEAGGAIVINVDEYAASPEEECDGTLVS